jgi:hypothetical protein
MTDSLIFPLDTLREALAWRCGVEPRVSLPVAFDELRSFYSSRQVPQAIGQLYNPNWHDWGQPNFWPDPAQYVHLIPPGDWSLVEYMPGSVNDETRGTGWLRFIGSGVPAWGAVRLDWKELFPLWVRGITEMKERALRVEAALFTSTHVKQGIHTERDRVVADDALAGEVADAARRARPRQNPVAWMNENATKIDKQKDLIKNCTLKTGATWREALEAYRALPEEQRRIRGRPAR